MLPTRFLQLEEETKRRLAKPEAAPAIAYTDHWPPKGGGEGIRLPTPHPGQVIVLNEKQRFNYLSAGRRWRKTTLAMRIAVEAAAAGGDILWGAPTYDQVRVGWEETRRAAGGHADFNTSRMTAAFRHGGRIRFRSLDDPDHARGHTADGVVIDECADVNPAAWSEVLLPMLMTTQGWCWQIGTPKGHNWWWREIERAKGDPACAVWTAPTLGARVTGNAIEYAPHPLENPNIPFAELERQWRAMPERVFRQEILGEFTDDGGGVFRNVRALCALAPGTPDAAHEFVIGVDWGRAGDFTCVSILDATTKEQVELHRSHRVEYAVQVARLRALCDRWRPSLVLAEANSIGEPIIEQLRRADVPVRAFTTTNASKAALIDDLALALERGALRLLDDPIQAAELEAFTCERLPTGLYRYAAPDGEHDDTVIALALAWHLAKDDRPALEEEEEPVPTIVEAHPKILTLFPGLKKRFGEG